MNRIDHFQIANYCSLCGRVFEPALQLKCCPADGCDLETIRDYFRGGRVGEAFIVTQLIGCGAFGLVFRATQVSFNRTVAIKLIHRHLLDKSDVSTRFMREAAIIGQLKHPNITSVIDYGVLGSGEPYLIMEFLSGMSLVNLLQRKGRFTFAEAYPIFSQICAGLSAAHEQSIIHRDIKPSNVFTTNVGQPSQQVKLVDFGLAKAIDDSAQAMRRLTASGMQMGTPQYMSPEACMGMTIDERSDIYSLGCVMYEMLTGCSALSGSNVLETMHKHIEQEPADFESCGIVVSPSVQHLIEKTLAKQPGNRFQSVADLQAALDECADEEANAQRAGSAQASPAGNVYKFLSSLAEHRRQFPPEYRGLGASLKLAWKGSRFLLRQGTRSSRSTETAQRVISLPALLGSSGEASDNVFDPAAMIESVVVAYREAARAKRISLMTYLDANLPLLVRGNPAYTRQVLTRALDNALSYTETGAVTVSAVLERVTNKTCTVSFRISDTGGGIAPEHIASTLRMFNFEEYNAEKAGIGLWVTRHLVESMGGKLTIESLENTGTTVAVSLPLEPIHVRHRASEPPSPFAGMRMLIVSSAANVPFAIGSAAEDLGLACQAVSSVTQADAQIRQHWGTSNEYDMVVIDEAVGNDCLRFARTLSGDRRLSRVNIIVLANSTNMSTWTGMDNLVGCLDKPVSRDDLVDCLVRALLRLKLGVRRVESNNPNGPSGVNQFSLGSFAVELEETVPAGVDETVSPWAMNDETAPINAAEPDSFDYRALESVAGPEKALQLLTNFVVTADALLSQIKAYGYARQSQPLVALAQQLHGAAAAIGANGIMRLACHLEKAASRSELEEALIFIEALEWSVSQLRKNHLSSTM